MVRVRASVSQKRPSASKSHGRALSTRSWRSQTISASRRVATNRKLKTVFPTRGVPGGWRDLWDDPDDSAELRARGETTERRQDREAARLGVVWQGEIAGEGV